VCDFWSISVTNLRMAATNEDRTGLPFAVVLFKKEQRFSTVPTSWVSSDKTICWWPGPATKKSSSELELIADPNSQPDKTYKGHPITYAKFFSKSNYNSYCFNFGFSNSETKHTYFILETLKKAELKAEKLRDLREKELGSTTEDDAFDAEDVPQTKFIKPTAVTLVSVDSQAEKQPISAPILEQGMNIYYYNKNLNPSGALTNEQ